MFKIFLLGIYLAVADYQSSSCSENEFFFSSAKPQRTLTLGLKFVKQILFENVTQLLIGYGYIKI